MGTQGTFAFSKIFLCEVTAILLELAGGLSFKPALTLRRSRLNVKQNSYSMLIGNVMEHEKSQGNRRYFCYAKVRAFRATSLYSSSRQISTSGQCCILHAYIHYSRPCCPSPSSRLFPTVSHAERTSTLRAGYEPLGSELVLGSRAVACWNNATEDFGLQMSEMPARYSSCSR